MKTEFKKNIRLLIIMFLLLILTAVLIWFVIDFRNLYKVGALRPTNSLFHHRQPVAKSTLLPGQIEDWMTFRYLNFIFRLPADYLVNKLKITAAAYPNLTLNKYAKMKKLNNAAFIELVRQAVAASANGGNP